MWVTGMNSHNHLFANSWFSFVIGNVNGVILCAHLHDAGAWFAEKGKIFNRFTIAFHGVKRESAVEKN